MSNEMQQRNNPVSQIKLYLSSDSVKERFKDMLGKNAGAFTNSIINVVRNSNGLQKCTPDSIGSAAMVAATVNLAIDPALGQAAIVPYGKIAQFQIMYKGLTQLCIRSGQYKTIHCTEVYDDEIESWNPITGEIAFTEQSAWKMRSEGKVGCVAGHYARFKLLAGFEKSGYITFDEAIAHAKRFSKAYQYDLRDKKKSSVWSTDPVSMGNKTVLKELLDKYGIKSIEMQAAFIADHEDFEAASDKAKSRIEDESGSEVIDVEPTEIPKQETDESIPAFMRD